MLVTSQFVINSNSDLSFIAISFVSSITNQYCTSFYAHTIAWMICASISWSKKNPSSRMNVSTGAARPNPQGSFHYGSINVSQVYKLRNEPPVIINGKKRTTLSGISYSPPDTPLRLADLYDKKGIYTLDFPTMPIDGPPVIRTSVINSTYKNFLEIVFQNNDTIVQTYHIDGYAFWVVG